MTINNVIAIALLTFIVLLAISTVLVSVALVKEIKKFKAVDKKEGEVD